MAFGFIGDLLGLNAGNATIDAAGRNKQTISNYKTEANSLIDSGSGQAQSYLDQVTGLYSPLAGSTALYANALGLNGAEGTAAAQSAYSSSPGYQFQLDQGLQALDRRRAASGSFQSGGADIDTLTYANGLASQDYGNWLDRLSGASTTALNGQTGALNNLANLATGTASQKLGVAGDATSALIANRNMKAQGEEANKAGIAGLGSGLFGLAGKALGWGGF